MTLGDYLTTFGLVLPVVLLILVGALFRGIQWLRPEADASLMKLVLNLFYPCLIFRNIVGNEALRETANWLGAPLLGFTAVCLGYLIGYYLPGRKSLNPAQRRSFAFTVGVFNYGYIPIPLSQALFPAATTGVLLVFNVGVEIAFWTIGLLVLTGLSSGGVNWRRLISPPLITILIAVPCNWLGVADFLNPGEDAATWITVAGPATDQALFLCSQVAIPLGLILIGASFYDLWISTDWWKGARIPAWACTIRLLFLPAAFLVMARWLPISDELKQVLILQAAMPAAVFPIVLTRVFGGDLKVALQVVLSTSLLSLLLIPLWIQCGRWFVGV